MSINNGLFTSNTDVWATPQDFFDLLDKFFNFDLDVCALKENAKCKKYFSPEDDGLSQKWKGTCWMNPPYGKEISKWVEKAYKESKKRDSTVVCLLPARTDTKWWHDYCTKGSIHFVKGRLKFGGSPNSAPFPSAIVIFGKKYKKIKIPFEVVIKGNMYIDEIFDLYGNYSIKDGMSISSIDYNILQDKIIRGYDGLIRIGKRKKGKKDE